MNLWKKANVHSIFVDTGAFSVKYNKRDSKRNEFLPCFDLIFQNKLTLVTSNAVIYEAYTRILFDTKGNMTSCLEFLKYVLQGRITVLRVSKEDELAAKAKVEKFKDKKKLTFVDALSSVLMEKNLIIKVLTVDQKHFNSMGFLVIPPVQNLFQHLQAQYNQT
jgi:predicted nucleic acid-binding protein